VTLVLAHRGANRHAPDNTLAAFSRAVELGADGVELDIHRTADGRLVVRHDAKTPAGLLSDMGLDTVRSAFPDVPTLEDALDVCAGLLVNVEIKNSVEEGDRDPSERAAILLVELLQRRGWRDRVLVSSFNMPSIDRVRSLAPNVSTGLLTWRTDPLQALAIAESHGHRAVHPGVRSLRRVGAGAVVARAHERGVKVNVWTVNNARELKRLAAAGVDGLITDVPDVALRALGR
jgi:glycerophosphoryl diester phosphodiesterase